MTRRISLLAALLALLLLVASAAAQEKSYSADRFDSSAVATSNGDLTVDEAITFRFTGGPFTYVFREIPTERTDGITGIVASVDGVVWPEGTEAGQVEIGGGNPVRIEWHLPPTSDAVHTFELQYTLRGVAYQGDGFDVLRWQPLPDEYEYTIAAGQYSVSYPDTAVLAGDPSILTGRADISFGEDQVTFSNGNLSPDETLVVEMGFQPGTLISAPPAWQAQQERQNGLIWVWVAAALALLGAGFVGLWAMLRPYGRKRASAAGILNEPPGELRPAMAGFLSGPESGPTWPHALGTLFDLARREFVAIEEVPAERWYKSRDFEVTLLRQSTDLRPHEQALLQLLFTDKDGMPHSTVRVSDIGGRITSSRWKLFKDALLDEAKAEGYLDRERKDAAKRLVVGGLLITLLAGLLFGAALLLVPSFGGWPMIAGFAVFAVGVIWMVSSAAVSPLSDRGASVAAAWEPFQRYIKDAAKGKADIIDPAAFERFLPFAAAYGQAEPWAKRFSKLGYTDAPAYFHALSSADDSNIALFIMLIVATNNSGGSAAGAASAGAAGAAAGGGASGAG